MNFFAALKIQKRKIVKKIKKWHINGCFDVHLQGIHFIKL